MNFKQWLLQLEAIDASTKELLLKAKAPKDELDAFVKELEDEPNLIDKKTAFTRFQTKFNIQKKEKDEDAQRKHFASVPNTTEEELKTYDFYKDENPQALREMMELLRKFIDKKLITLKFENNKPVLIRNTLQGEQKFDTPDFNRFMSSLHGIQASLEQYKGKGNYFNPIEEELNHQQNLVAKGNNVWVFKGHAPDVCRAYGKGHPWCISSSTSAAYWFSYRINYHQTQYFVFDFNKDEDDPARYVNPGVAPEGRYSEWVDARNQHSEDPEDVNSKPRSHVGINGYTSINQYKKYLASKGIPLDTWKTTPPEEWEKRLSEYDKKENFQGAKNDNDSRVFPMYLKIVSSIKDSDFESLKKEQKIEFVMGKVTELTDKQIEFVKTNIKKSDYYSSLQDLNDKIKAAARFDDKPLLQKIASMPELSDDNVYNLLIYDKDEMAQILGSDNISKLSDKNVFNLLRYFTITKNQIEKIIIQYKKELSDKNVHDLLAGANDQEQMAQALGSHNISKLSDENVYNLLINATDKEKIIKILESDNISKLNSFNVYTLFHRLETKYEIKRMAEFIIKYKKEISANNLSVIIEKMNKHASGITYRDATDEELDEIAKLIMQYQKEIADDTVEVLLKISLDKDKMAKHIIKYKKEFSDKSINALLKAVNDKDEMAKEIIQYKKELSNENVFSLLAYAKDKEEISNLIIQYKKELSSRDVKNLLQSATDIDFMAQKLGSKNINKLTEEDVNVMLWFAQELDKTAKILGSYNISKLQWIYIRNLLENAKDQKHMAQILNTYYQNKTPQIQEEIDKYL